MEKNLRNEMYCFIGGSLLGDSVGPDSAMDLHNWAIPIIFNEETNALAINIGTAIVETAKTNTVIAERVRTFLKKASRLVSLLYQHEPQTEFYIAAFELALAEPSRPVTTASAPVILDLNLDLQ
jgi:hypothetical protein